MRALATAFLVLLGPASVMAEGRSEMDILRARCTEQERQIRTLEKDIESLHSQLALERRRSRGIEPSAATASHLPPAPQTSYIVKTGDTLSSIARRYRTSAVELMKHNGIEDPTRLRVGQKLTLPAEAEVPKATPAPAPKTQIVENRASKPAPPETAKTNPSNDYKVQRGDTLYGIARQHKIDIASLRALNPKLQDKIIIGQTISVTGEVRTAPAVSSLGRSKTLTIATKTSPPKPKKPAAKPKPKAKAKPIVAKKSPAKAKPAPSEKKEAVSKPEPAATPPTPPAVAKKDEPASAPKTISSIFVMDEISFGDFASKHGTSPQQLNALNGWDFKSNLLLARGSEIYVPGR